MAPPLFEGVPGLHVWSDYLTQVEIINFFFPWNSLKKNSTEQARFLHAVILNCHLKSLLLVQELSKMLALRGPISVLWDVFKYRAKK